MGRDSSRPNFIFRTRLFRPDTCGKAIRGEHSHLFQYRLCNDQAVEGIAVVQSEIVYLEGMKVRHREWPQSLLRHESRYALSRRRRENQFAEACFDAQLPRARGGKVYFRLAALYYFATESVDSFDGRDTP